MKEWGIQTKGLTSKEEALSRIAEFWNAQKTKPARTPKEVENGLKKAIETHKKHKIALSRKYDALLNYYHNLPQQYKLDIDDVFHNIEQTVTVKKKELEFSECTILIAGETAAGKSSLINLLLETKEDILPTSQLKCTATICEIKTSRTGRKYYTLHRKAEGGKQYRPEEHEIKSKEDLNVLKEHIVATDDDSEESPYIKIEIFWPFQILEDGIVIVDTPGIGGGNQMSDCMQQYLAKSFGFVYVINSSSAGGVQKGRLQDLLRQVVSSSDEEFNSDCTMFICNKWDQIPERDREEVRINTCRKLQRYYPSVKEEQLYCMSIDEALKGVNLGTITAEHQGVLEGFQRLLPASLENQLNSHYRWISQVLKRSLYSLKVAKLMDARGMKEKEEMRGSLQRQMEMLERNANFSIENLKKGVKFEVETLELSISSLLRSPEVTSQLRKWDASDCPKPNNWKNVVKEASEVISSRVVIEINRWDKDKNIVRGLKEKIVKKFKKDFELMEDQMKDIEGVLLQGETKVVRDLHRSIKRPTPVKDIFKSASKGSGKDENTTGGIGSAVGSAGTLDPKSKSIKKLFKNYKAKNCCEVMAEATGEFLDSILNGVMLQAKINTFLSKYIKGLDSIAKMIPQFINADKKLMATLSTQMSESVSNLKELYPGLIRDCSTLQGELDVFYAYNIMKPDYRLRELKWDTNDRLGSGSFADVYKAQLNKGKTSIPVAIKVCKDPVGANTISEILLEDRTMRDVEHKNIIRYYGSTLSQQSTKSGYKVTWIMILEFCDGTMKDKFLDPEFSNPAKAKTQSKQLDAMKTMADFASQICDGLDYLHSKGLVHRDLKLENILVANDDQVKLTDVGLTKHVADIAGTQAGSPVYMAPEVLRAEDIYNSKVDIYSLAIILWEMWYGIDAAEHIGRQMYKTLLESVEGGLRPSMSIPERPPENWANVIRACWEYSQTNRPDAKTRWKKLLSRFIREPGKMSNCSNALPYTDTLFSEIRDEAAVIIFTVLSGLCFLVVMCIYIEELIFIYKRYHGERRLQIVILLTLYPVVSSMTFLSLIVPRTTIVADFISSLIISLCIIQFSHMIIGFFGGEEKLLEFYKEKTISFQTPPCCCCCACLPKAQMTKRVLDNVKMMIYQICLIRPLALFLLIIFWVDSRYSLGDQNNFTRPGIYLNLIGGFSTIIAMYGLLILNRNTRDFLKDRRIELKFATLQLVIVCTYVQNVILNALGRFNVPPCADTRDSNLRARRIHYFILSIEILIFAIMARFAYRREEIEPDELAASTKMEVVKGNQNQSNGTAGDTVVSVNKETENS